MKSVNEIFLNIADKDRIKADLQLSDGLLSDELINALKTDIVNLTNLKNPTEQEKKVSLVYINLINWTLDKHYDRLMHPEPYSDAQKHLTIKTKHY